MYSWIKLLLNVIAKSSLWQIKYAVFCHMIEERYELGNLLNQYDEKMTLLCFNFILCHQVVLRQQEVNDKLHSWTEFNEKFRDLTERLAHLEERISSNTELQIEDLLNKLEQVSVMPNLHRELPE